MRISSDDTFYLFCVKINICDFLSRKIHGIYTIRSKFPYLSGVSFDNAPTAALNRFVAFNLFIYSGSDVKEGATLQWRFGDSLKMQKKRRITESFELMREN